MRSSIELGISLATQKIEVDPRLSLTGYYLIAENLLKQASIYREEKNNIDLYTILLRFCSLLAETIPFHRDYHASDQREKTIFKWSELFFCISCFVLLTEIIVCSNELESLKPEVMQKIDEIKKKGHKPRGNTSTMSSEASSTGFNRCKQAMPSPQLHPNSPGPLMSRLSILISPSRSSSQLSLHSSFPNNRTFPSVNEIQSGPSPSASPIEDLDIIEDPQCKFPSTYQKQPIGACVPCGHMVGCMACLNEIKDKGWGCPVCQY
ncbi:hypothetical protein LIER_03853 [Lithospermum erythrorhizon]|uniref:USP8 dimerisation domain-containing protein n=1 Tax=Lithospermum erythrorhizon TaxID=34254 RepID=A0AAV3NYP3_LITER